MQMDVQKQDFAGIFALMQRGGECDGTIAPSHLHVAEHDLPVYADSRAPGKPKGKLHVPIALRDKARVEKGRQQARVSAKPGKGKLSVGFCHPVIFPAALLPIKRKRLPLPDFFQSGKEPPRLIPEIGVIR